MTTYAYLPREKKSTYVQERHDELVKFAESQNLTITHRIEEFMLRKPKTNERLLRKMLEGMQEGDVLIIPGISRLGRGIIEETAILNLCVQKKIRIVSRLDEIVNQQKLDETNMGMVARN